MLNCHEVVRCIDGFTIRHGVWVVINSVCNCIFYFDANSAAFSQAVTSIFDALMEFSSPYPVLKIKEKLESGIVGLSAWLRAIQLACRNNYLRVRSLSLSDLTGQAHLRDFTSDRIEQTLVEQQRLLAQQDAGG